MTSTNALILDAATALVAEPARYTIHYVADETCSSIDSDVLASSDDAAEAKRLAVQHAGMGTYGTAIRDSATGEIDFGRGFGVAISDDGEEA